MPLKQFIYEHAGCPLSSCEQGEFELQVGENVQIVLDPKNPDWTTEFTAEVIAVEKSPNGRNYTLQYDDIVIGAGGVMFEGCDIRSIEPYCCCDELDDRVTVLEAKIDVDTFSTISDNGDGTASVTNADGTSGPCLKTCDDVDDDTQYTLEYGCPTGTIDCGVINLIDDQGTIISTLTLPADDIDISSFTASISNGIVTLIHGAGGIGTPFQFPLGISSLSTVNNPDGSVTISYVDGSGNTQVAGVIPAGSTSSVTSVVNPDGSTTYTHDDGDSSTPPVTWVTYPNVDNGSLTGVADPNDPCSLRLSHASSNGSASNIDGVAQTNNYTEQSVPSNSVGTYVTHEVRGESDGVGLTDVFADTDSTLGAQDTETGLPENRVLIEEIKVGCTRSTRINVVEYRGNTLIVDKHYNATGGQRERGDMNYPTIAAANADSRDGDTILVRPGIYDESVVVQSNRTYHMEGVTLTRSFAGGTAAYCIQIIDGTLENVRVTGKPNLIGTGGGVYGGFVGDKLFDSFFDLGVIDVGITGWFAGNSTSRDLEYNNVVVKAIKIIGGGENTSITGASNGVIINSTNRTNITFDVSERIESNSTVSNPSQGFGAALTISNVTPLGEQGVIVDTPLITQTGGQNAVQPAATDFSKLTIRNAHIQVDTTTSWPITAVGTVTAGSNNRFILRNVSVSNLAGVNTATSGDSNGTPDGIRTVIVGGLDSNLPFQSTWDTNILVGTVNVDPNLIF